MDRFYRALKWSFEALATGRWPRSDYMGRRYPRGSGGADRAGKRLARKHTAVLFCCKGDLDHFWKSMQAPSFHSSSPCAHCNADRDQNPWWDVRPTARWRQQLRSYPHRMDPVRLCPDWMHSKHLGTDAYIVASVLAIIVFRKM